MVKQKLIFLLLILYIIDNFNPQLIMGNMINCSRNSMLQLENEFCPLIEEGNSSAMHKLGYYNGVKKDYRNMEKYYLMAIERNHYRKIKDYPNILKYLSMAIQKGNAKAEYNLAIYFYEIKDYINMEKYYLRAVHNGLPNAMFNLGRYYEETNDYQSMEKYYLLAIEKNHICAKINLEKYYKKQIRNGNIDVISLKQNNIKSEQNRNLLVW